MTSRKLVLAAGVAVAAFGFTLPAVAQEVPTVQEVIVTAQKRSERAQDVAASVAVLTADSLQKSGASDYTEYLNTIPSVSYAKNGGFKDKIFIRGLSDSMSSRVSSTTGVYLDETPITEVDASLGDFGTFDIERVEVLRGPQGTLFGSGSMGGTVRIITRKPQLNSFGGQLAAELSDTKDGGTNSQVDAILNVPLITDKLAVRAGYSNRHDSGFIDNLVKGSAAGDENVNTRNAATFRLQAAARPTENLDVLLSFNYQQAKEKHGPNQDVGLPEHTFKRTYPEFHRFKSRVYNATLNYTLPFATLTSVTSYIDKRNFTVRDLSNLYLSQYQQYTGVTQPNEGYGLAYIYPNKAFIQEVRATSSGDGPLHWVAGAYYSNFYPTNTQYGTSTLPNEAQFRDGFQFNTQNYHRRETAAFAEVSFDVTDKLQLTAGIRRAEFRIGQTGYTTGLLNGGPLRVNPPIDLTQKATVFKFRGEYKITPAHMVYAVASQGYRPGGGGSPFQPSCLAQLQALGYAPPGPTQYDPDKLWNYELGSKNQFFDRRLTLNGSAYYIDWSNTQLAQNLTCGAQFISNAGGARVKGAELEAQIAPITGLNLSAGVGYTEATFTRTDTTIRTRKGAPLPNAPRWTASFAADYRWAVSGDVEAYVHGDYQYVSSRYNDLPLLTTTYYQPDYQIINARIGVNRGPWDASLFIKNLGDEVAILNTANASGLYLQSVNTPRTIGATIRRDF